MSLDLFLQKKHLHICFQVEVGKLKPYYYNVNGAVHVFDSQSLLIKNFSYTGQGPDAILYAGVSGRSHEVIF